MASGVLPYDNDDHFNNNTKNPDANSYCPNNNPFLSFGGRQWWINYHWSQQTGTYADEPFKSIFDPKIIEKVGDAVRLWIRRPTQSNQPWRTSELVLANKLGWGRYLVTARVDGGGSFSDLDPNAVFGAFTYQYSEAPPSNGPNIHREIDALEVLRGGNSNAQFTLQPYDYSNPHPWNPFTIPPNTPVITIVLDWVLEGGVERGAYFALFLGDYSLDTLPPIQSGFQFWAPGHKGFAKLIPDHTDTSCERFHINLWLMHGAAPAREQSVLLTRFQYKTLP